MSPCDTLAAYFCALDKWDVEGMLVHLDDRIEFADEISGGWGRLEGPEAIRSYTESLASMITGLCSELSELNERVYQGAATVTGRLRQAYTLNGEPRQYFFLISAVFRRTSDDWKMCLGHMTPVSGPAW